MRTEIVTPPSIEPVTLQEAKDQLRVTFTAQDALITGLIRSAREKCETEVDRIFITTELDYFLDEFPRADGQARNRSERLAALTIRLPFAPLIAVESVKYYDLSGTLQTLDPSLYIAPKGTPARISPIAFNGWPGTQERIDAVVIRLTAGYGPTADPPLPESVKNAIKVAVADFYANRETAELSDSILRILDPVRWGY